MRLTFILTLLVATFVASYVGFTSTESVAFIKNVDNGVRRLRVSGHVQEERGAGDALARFFSSLNTKSSNTMATGAVEAAKLSDDQMAKLSKILENSDMARNAFQVSDDEVAKMSVLVQKANAGDGVGLTDDEVAKFANAFAAAKKDAGLTNSQVLKLSKMIANAKKVKEVKEAAKASDDEVAKVADMFKKANAGATGGTKITDDELAKLSKAFAAAQKGAGLTDDQVNNMAKLIAEAKQISAVTDDQIAKLSQGFAVVAKKDKKSWSTVKKVIVGTLGVGVGGAVIYGVAKLTTNNSGSTTAATTTTTSSV